MFVLLLLLGFGSRLGYGIVRYQVRLLHLRGNAFISSWDHDAFYDVLIAKALMSGEGYIVDPSSVAAARHVRYLGQDAVFKAPLYQYFLAALFGVSGYTFKLFFPVQAFLGGITSGVVGLIGWNVFGRVRAGWFAGLLAAVQPVLVNSASQPYNENVFYFFFVFSVWAFLMWLGTQRERWAVLCGISTGLCLLTRENASVLLIAMGGVLLLRRPWTLKSWLGYGLIVVWFVAVVAPWTMRNYVHFRAFIPVASIVGADLAEGNNECIMSEGIFVPYWGEGSCPPAQEQRHALLRTQAIDPRLPEAVRVDKASRRIALKFIREHPGAYVKLCVRRFWTALLPFNPRGSQGRSKKLALFFYWFILFPAGIAGLIVGLKQMDPGRNLLALLVILNLLSIAAVLYWSDLRFRVGIDLPLACFAGWAYCELASRMWRHNLVVCED